MSALAALLRAARGEPPEAAASALPRPPQPFEAGWETRSAAPGRDEIATSLPHDPTPDRAPSPPPMRRPSDAAAQPRHAARAISPADDTAARPDRSAGEAALWPPSAPRALRQSAPTRPDPASPPAAVATVTPKSVDPASAGETTRLAPLDRIAPHRSAAHAAPTQQTTAVAPRPLDPPPGAPQLSGSQFPKTRRGERAAPSETTSGASAAATADARPAASLVAAPLRPAPPPEPVRAAPPPQPPTLEISVGRVTVAAPAPPPVAAARPGPAVSRGFAGLAAARRGVLR